MSTHSNPFVQGGWYGQSPFTVGPDGAGTPPSTFGALPGGSEPAPEGATVFMFINPNPNILNSIVVDSSNRPIYKVTTNSSLEGYTQFKDVENKAVALIEWIAQPKVEIRGSLPKVVASEWIPVTADQRFGRSVRRMTYRGATFVWCPKGESLSLYTQSPNSSPCVVVNKRKQTVDLVMSPQALAWGLLEPCVVAVTLMLSGRRLE